MRAVLFLVYAFVSYSIGIASLLWMMAFLGNVFLPVTVNGPATSLPFAAAIGVNIALLLVFGMHHTAFARQGVKSWLARFHAEGLIRSTYCLIAGALLLAACTLWQPMPGAIWHVEGETGRNTLHALYLFGWVVVFLTTFLIDHFELVGLRQAWFSARRRNVPDIAFKTPLLYRVVRHPMQTGFLVLLWATPDMTIGRLVFASGMSIYILVGLIYEERDLLRNFGDAYARYRAAVPKLIPFIPFPR